MQKGKILCGSGYYANKRSVGMKKILVLSFCCFFAFTILACESKVGLIDEPEQVEEITLSQDDFVLRIDTLPYRGAVLFIDYTGELVLDNYDLSVDILLNDTVMQEEMPVEEVDGNMVAEIVDLMYLPGDELDFTLKIYEEESEIFEYYHSEQLQRYPWKDWMLAEGEWFSLKSPFNYIDNFVYGRPSYGGVGAHSSWDIWTTSGKAVNVYSGTIGIVNRKVTEHQNLEIYNPYVGAIVQYGHTEPVEGLYVGKIIMPGEHISDIIPNERHIHYSVIRPYRYKLRKDGNHYYYFPVITYNGLFIYHDSYNDPFYWHEPTTLGYWNEETLPLGLKEEMLNMFQRDNPDVALPATKPLNTE
jgi:hypothetical protein